MRLDDQRESDNVEDRRGSGGGGLSLGGGNLGIGGIIIALAASYFLGVNPLTVLNLLSGGNPVAPQSAPAAHKPPADDPMTHFVAKVLASTEDTWSEVFRANGRQYEKPRLVLFTGATPTACGTGQTAMGPFYCPGDHKVYIDLAFYRELKDRFKAPGEFAQAYVIAHEVGHHIQTLLGVSAQVNKARQRGDKVTGDGGLLVRQELQADCLAGVWAHHAQARHQWLDDGDLAEAMNTATAIGDDRLQQQSQGTVVPDAFSHGTSAQRVRWFRVGFEGGEVAGCDTFEAATL